MAGRKSNQAISSLEIGRIPVPTILSNSSTAPNPDLKDNRIFPSLNSTLSNSSCAQSIKPQAQQRQVLQPSITDLTPLEQGGLPRNTNDTVISTTSASFVQVALNATEPEQAISDLVFPVKQITLHQGKPSIAFNSQETSELLAGLNFILIGKFTHGRPPMTAIKKLFATQKLKGKVNFSLMDKKHVFIECLCKADYYFIWLKLRWSIQGYTMRIFKWDSNFASSKESSIAPVWIRLENLPLYFFEVKTLLSIANVIGSPILIDPKNVNRSDLGAARLCVELDVAKPLIDAIWINLVDDSSKMLGGFWVHVSYDVVPAFCLKCFHIEHDRANCKRVMGERKAAFASITASDQWKEAVITQQPVPLKQLQLNSDYSATDGLRAENSVVQNGVDSIAGTDPCPVAADSDSTVEPFVASITAAVQAVPVVSADSKPLVSDPNCAADSVVTVAGIVEQCRPAEKSVVQMTNVIGADNTVVDTLVASVAAVHKPTAAIQVVPITSADTNHPASASNCAAIPVVSVAETIVDQPAVNNVEQMSNVRYSANVGADAAKTSPAVPDANTSSDAVLEMQRPVEGLISAADMTSAGLELRVPADTQGEERQQATEQTPKSQVLNYSQKLIPAVQVTPTVPQIELQVLQQTEKLELRVPVLNLQDVNSQTVASSTSSKSKQYATQNKLPQVWQRVKGQSAMKNQTETASFKKKNAENTTDKAKILSTVNRFSALITEPVPELNVAPFECSRVEQIEMQDMDAHLATTAADSVSAVATITTVGPDEASPGKEETATTTAAEAAPSNIPTVVALHSKDAADTELSAVQEVPEVQQGGGLISTTPRQKATKTTSTHINMAVTDQVIKSARLSSGRNTALGVTTRAAAKKRDNIRFYTAQEKEEIMQRAIASALEEEQDDDDRQPFIPPKPATKDGYPAVCFKKSDLRRWATRAGTRANNEKEQMRTNGFTFDDKG